MEARGETVILWLFLVLAVSVVAVFTVFGFYIEEQEIRAELLPIVLRNLYLPVVGTSILVAIDAQRRGRSGWWIYLVTAPVPGLNIVLAVQWLRRWRETPRSLGRWDL